MALDEKDFAILDALKEDAGVSLTVLSRKTGIPPATLHYRLRFLRKEKIIVRETVDLDYKKIGRGIKAFILIEAADAASGGKDLPKMVEVLKRIPGVEEADSVTGTVDVLVKARASSIDQLSEMILKKIRLVPGVARVNTMLSLA
ncbi:MAG TPA: Lrp/AsnC family transcriptional regulator [Candidatus Norongarragalinales archaeon]|nr:Lrp/AsnC family transcriptional regulator [Candidatus Norongarragalinales archaeon]